MRNIELHDQTGEIVKYRSQLPHGSEYKFRRMRCGRCHYQGAQALVVEDDPSSWPLHRCEVLPYSPLSPFTSTIQLTQRGPPIPIGMSVPETMRPIGF